MDPSIFHANVRRQVLPEGPSAGAEKSPRSSREAELGAISDTSTLPDENVAKMEQVSRQTKGFGPRPTCFKNTFHEVMFIMQATIAVAATSFLIGASVVVTNKIGQDLSMTQSQITWIGASSALTAGAFQLPLGQLADLLGRKPVFLAGMASFALLLLVAGLARDPYWLDASMGALGLASAAVVPPAVGILGAAYAAPGRRKNAAFAACAAGNPLGFAFGTVLCGVASHLSGWRAAFLAAAAVWALLALKAVWAVPAVEGPAPQRARGSLRARLRGSATRFDLVGTVLVILGTGAFTAALTLGPADGWTAAHVIAMLVAGVALVGIFVLWERTYAFPLMPLHIWRDRNFTLLLITSTLGCMSFTSASFWLALEMQQVQELEPLDVALYMLPQAVSGIVWNLIAGNILHLVNNTVIMAVGSVAYVTANTLLSLMKANSLYWKFAFPGLILNVVGADFQFNVVNMYVMQSLPPDQQSLASGILNMLIRLSTTVALGISTAVYSSVALTAAGTADSMLKYTRAFQVSLAFACASLCVVPFVKLGTQGNSPDNSLGEVENSEHGAMVSIGDGDMSRRCGMDA